MCVCADIRNDSITALWLMRFALWCWCLLLLLLAGGSDSDEYNSSSSSVIFCATSWLMRLVNRRVFLSQGSLLYDICLFWLYIDFSRTSWYTARCYSQVIFIYARWLNELTPMISCDYNVRMDRIPQETLLFSFLHTSDAPDIILELETVEN